MKKQKKKYTDVRQKEKTDEKSVRHFAAVIFLWIPVSASLGDKGYPTLPVPPSKRTTLVIRTNGKPYGKPLNFWLVCYGRKPYGFYVAGEVSANCPTRPRIIDNDFHHATPHLSKEIAIAISGVG